MSAVPRAAADDEEEARRATPLGFFEFAETYRAAALALEAAAPSSPHAQAPVRLLRYHTVELYLKAFLRLHGHEAKELCGEGFGHRMDRLSSRAIELGLPCEAEDDAVFGRMAQTEPLVRSRYFRTASFAWPDMAALARTCERLRERVGAAVRR